jgi:hypothetical protein
MTTATRARKPRTRPQRRMSVGAPTNGCFAVRLQFGKDSCCYFVEPIDGAAFGTAAFRLVKFSCDRKEGEPDSYEVLVDADRPTGSVCCCKGFERWGWHKDAEGNLVSCRHIDALLALVAQGRLQLPQCPAVKLPADLEADFA